MSTWCQLEPSVSGIVAADWGQGLQCFQGLEGSTNQS